MTNKYEKWILLGIPIISIIGSFMHFAFNFSGNLKIVALFAPINESIWEHLKLAFFPTLLWWIIGFFLFNKDSNFKKRNYICSMILSALIAPLIITCFYYTYTGALGISSLILDIFSLYLSILLSQILGIHTYKYGNFSIKTFVILVLILIITILLFWIFTFKPPHIPLFLDSSKGIYGI